MLSVDEVENMRRSAAMSSLWIDDQRRLLDACTKMAREGTQIAAVLDELPTSWASVRKAMNERHRLLMQ